MILIINICKNKLHYFEFVKPIEDILKSSKKDYLVKHYKEIKGSDLDGIEKVIICGTSIKDNSFISDMDYFSWILNFEGSILGICGGFEILGLIYGAKIIKNLEIGFFHESLIKPFLGLEGEIEVYHLHENSLDFSGIEEIDVFSSSKFVQAIKHKKKNFYGVLFHPEVRNKEMITNFSNE